MHTVNPQVNQVKSRFRRKQTRRGAATVEFALIVPVMLTFTFGLIEMGRISMIKEAVVQASREGARVGVRPTASIEDVQTRVNEELAIMNLTSANVVITPSFLEEAAPGDDIKVRITIPISEISYVPGFFAFDGLDIVAETVMRRESTG
ncbi:pilus assembly protein TadE [Rhodopirellula sp. SM50]|nr:pilus assembly protein TadE [Rhodopirellula sp. SM50]